MKSTAFVGYLLLPQFLSKSCVVTSTVCPAISRKIFPYRSNFIGCCNCLTGWSRSLRLQPVVMSIVSKVSDYLSQHQLNCVYLAHMYPRSSSRTLDKLKGPPTRQRVIEKKARWREPLFSSNVFGH